MVDDSKCLSLIFKYLVVGGLINLIYLWRQARALAPEDLAMTPKAGISHVIVGKSISLTRQCTLMSSKSTISTKNSC